MTTRGSTPSWERSEHTLVSLIIQVSKEEENFLSALLNQQLLQNNERASDIDKCNIILRN